MGKICVFFGHRDIPEDLEPQLRELIIRAITEFGVTEFWNGCYGNFDALAAQVVISLKPLYPQIKLTQVYAYPPTGSTLRRGFDRAFLPSILADICNNTCIPRRNIWMAYHCDMIIAYVNHAESKIHEPIDRMHGRKPVFNLGIYQPHEKSTD